MLFHDYLHCSLNTNWSQMKCVMRCALTWFLNCFWNWLCSFIWLSLCLKDTEDNYGITLCLGSKPEEGGQSCPRNIMVLLPIHRWWKNATKLICSVIVTWFFSVTQEIGWNITLGSKAVVSWLSKWSRNNCYVHVYAGCDRLRLKKREWLVCYICNKE